MIMFNVIIMLVHIKLYMSYVVCVLCIGCIISIQCYVKIDSSISINQSIFFVQWHVINLKSVAVFLQFIVIIFQSLYLSFCFH